MAKIRRIKIFLEPIILEFDEGEEKLQKNGALLDATPKRIADLGSGDVVSVLATVLKIEPLEDVPTLDTFAPDIPLSPHPGTKR